MDHLQGIIKEVESSGREVGVTLLVSGVVVSGYITPWSRYQRWEREVGMRSLHEGGRSTTLNFGLGPITAAGTREAQASWDRLVAERAREGRGEEEFHFERFALRSAVAETGVNRDRWREFMFLVISADAVDAYFVGLQATEETEEGEQLTGPDAFDARYRERPAGDEPANPA